MNDISVDVRSGPTWLCPIHGKVYSINFVYDDKDLHIDRSVCFLCFVAWVGKNVAWVGKNMTAIESIVLGNGA